MKLHVGNGSIYLKGWTNVDLPLPTVFLAKDRPDLVEKFSTNEENYYSRHEDKTQEKLREGAVIQETVCDVYGSFEFLPVHPGSVDEILACQVFEHLDRTEAKEALKECHLVLKPGGFLRLDVPDPDQTLFEYLRTGDDFYRRHLFGPRRNVWGFHTHWTKAMLKELVEGFAFKFVAEESNRHFYPAFCLRFKSVTI